MEQFPIAHYVMLSYEVRACFVCARFGTCGHREFEVEAALIEVQLRPKQVKNPKKGKVTEIA